MTAAGYRSTYDGAPEEGGDVAAVRTMVGLLMIERLEHGHRRDPCRNRRPTTNIVATLLQIVFLGSGFGVRMYLHARKTGSTGFRALGATRSPAEALGAGGIALGIVGSLAGTVLGLAAVLDPLSIADHAWLRWPGAGVATLATALVVAAQSNMGSSWRVGVDQSETTDLVTGGLFSLTRNPIFLGIVLFYAGIALLVPNVLTIAPFVVIVLTVEVQVRLVEEPYLTRTHGDAYLAYASRTGRLIPGIGRLRRPRGAAAPPSAG